MSNITAEARRIYSDNYLFGGNREKAIQRDGEKCVQCGITRDEHRKKYGYDITVDHIDGRGKSSPKAEKNNDMSNLQTLCTRCHVTKDVQYKKLTAMQIINIRHIGRAVTAQRLAELYNVGDQIIYNIRHHRVGDARIEAFERSLMMSTEETHHG